MTRATATHTGPLARLAHRYGVQTAYYDVTHRRRAVSPDALLLTLRALGAPIGSHRDVAAALRERQQALWKRGVEPVLVAWDGVPLEIELRLAMDQATHPVTCQLTLESGDARMWTFDPARLPLKQTVEIEGQRFAAKRVTLPITLPWGYHGLRIENRGSRFESMIIAAPLRAYPGSEDSARGVWGVFLPLYALHSTRSWGAGDFGDLETLVDWVAGLGGRVVATLPLLAAFLDEPCDPSPYAPVSRLFWNEFYLDVTRIPEIRTCSAAQALLESTGMQGELAALRSSPLVDYRRQMAAKRRVLEELVRCFFTETPERHTAYRRFVEAHPQVEDYARFRATGEQRGRPWPSWPAPLRNGILKEGDFTEDARRYHLYVQWKAHEQIQDLSLKTKAAGVNVHLDLPLGVHSYGYDVWRERDAFALDVSGGAPPDVVFTKGQDWGFPPLHPEAIRTQRYRYFIAYVRHQLKYTGLLRIDHVMAFHRLYWIPKGLEPREGVYVRYPAEELYAILCLESHRHQASIVGENLGTVPTYVNATMARHNFRRMYVVQYELVPGARRVLRPVTADSVASLNTHDMPPFGAYWQCLDVDDRLRLGLLNATGARIERKNRQALEHALEIFLERRGWLEEQSANPQALLKACLAFLSASPASIVLVNIEDLWLERQAQNVPGTHAERPNWRRKARYSFDGFCRMPRVLETIRAVDHGRKRVRRARGGKPATRNA